MAAYDLAALRAYVVGGKEPELHAPDGQARLSITHSVIKIGNERNFPIAITISSLKDKLHLVVGTSPSYMKLQLMENDGTLIANLDDDALTLAHYGTRDGMRIHVIDEDPSNAMASLQDTSQVEKYVLSEEEYNKRDVSYRKWKQQQASSSASSSSSASAAVEQKEEVCPEHIHVGDRCEVDSEDGSLGRKGTVMYVGKVSFSTGYWVGIKLDEPLGKNDGSVKGKRYFECVPNYGTFVKPFKVRVGDYPEDNFDEI